MEMDHLKQIDNLERRVVTCPIDVRESDSGVKNIVGHGAVFDKRSENLGGFVEVIHRDAFKEADSSDVRGLINHDPNLILGRTAADTMELKVDDVGLRYEITPDPEISYVGDLLRSIERGDITQSSFAFTIQADEWEELPDSRLLLRTILKVDRLFDVSPVTYPAYPDADVGLRSMNEYIAHMTDTQAVRLLHRQSLEYSQRHLAR